MKTIEFSGWMYNLDLIGEYVWFRNRPKDTKVECYVLIPRIRNSTKVSIIEPRTLVNKCGICNCFVI